MLINKPYLEEYFSNIISEKWLFNDDFEKFCDLNAPLPPKIGKFTLKNPIQKKIINFNVSLIQVLIFDEKFKEEHYIIGKCHSYFFLSIRKDEKEYPWVSIVKNATLAPLIKKITYFKEMFPCVKGGDFANKLLFNNKLSDDLVEKKCEHKKISKI